MNRSKFSKEWKGIALNLVTFLLVLGAFRLAVWFLHLVN